MKVLFKQVTIIDPHSTHHKQEVDLLIESGRIVSISTHIKETNNVDEVIQASGLLASSGWIDMQTTSGDPGAEYKEDLSSLLNAAAYGGFTAIGLLPNTQPVIQSKEGVEYIKGRTQQNIVQTHIFGALTQSCGGKDLTEMVDMRNAGAIAFTDGKKGTQHTGVLLKALQYLYKEEKPLITRPFDEYISFDGQMHEGIYSTLNGMKGIPSIAESIIVKRDLDVLKYSGGRLHFSAISTQESVALIKQAKKDGLKITCDVALANLLFTDESVGFDTNYKVFPPLRSEQDRSALIEGLLDDTIDCIVSDHNPQDDDSKKLEFDYADFGMSGIETMFSALISKVGKLSVDKIIEKITIGPRAVLGLPTTTIEEGVKADLTIFSTEEEYIYERSNVKSKSYNNPLIGESLKGKAQYIVNKDQVKHLV